ncbi:MAG: ester cyclase [Parachlamydiaceae bacterium]|nr:ester cyclase [Parachlamydiaceae bacterium]
MDTNIKAIALEYANSIWNDKEVNSIDKLVHPDVVIHSALGDFHGVDAMREVVQVWLKGFPDLIVNNDLVISENDLVSIQWQAKGTHKGPFKGRAATDKTISYSGVTVYRIKKSKIIEYWAYLDMQHLHNQMM